MIFIAQNLLIYSDFLRHYIAIYCKTSLALVGTFDSLLPSQQYKPMSCPRNSTLSHTFFDVCIFLILDWQLPRWRVVVAARASRIKEVLAAKPRRYRAKISGRPPMQWDVQKGASVFPPLCLLLFFRLAAPKAVSGGFSANCANRRSTCRRNVAESTNKPPRIVCKQSHVSMIDLVAAKLPTAGVDELQVLFLSYCTLSTFHVISLLSFSLNSLCFLDMFDRSFGQNFEMYWMYCIWSKIATYSMKVNATISWFFSLMCPVCCVFVLLWSWGVSLDRRVWCPVWRKTHILVVSFVAFRKHMRVTRALVLVVAALKHNFCKPFREVLIVHETREGSSISFSVLSRSNWVHSQLSQRSISGWSAREIN